MSSKGEQIRAAIAEEAGEWFVANEEGPLDAPDSAALAAWLKTSPLHVEEFLGVSVIARDLKEARTDPQYSIEAILGRAREEGGAAVQPFWPRVVLAARHRPRRWLPLAVTIAACTLLSLGALLTWKFGLTHHSPPAEGVAAMYFRTGHGEQLTHRLADDSVLHLDTDSAVTIRYSNNERLVTLIAGQADFEVAHEPNRPFRVLAGSAEIIDIGTKFDVRLEQRSDRGDRGRRKGRGRTLTRENSARTRGNPKQRDLSSWRPDSSSAWSRESGLPPDYGRRAKHDRLAASGNRV